MSGSRSLSTLLRRGVEADAYVGAAAAVGDADGGLAVDCVGFEDERGGDPVTRETRFDVASLTKPVVTTTVCARLLERDTVQLWAPLAEYVPPLEGTARGEIPLRDLLCHTSGLPPYKSFPFGWESPEALRESLYTSHLGLLADPGEWFVYSDLNFVHLADALARAAGESLSSLASAHVFDPLGMERASLGPLEATSDVAATRDHRWRNERLRGEIHDYIGAVLGAESGNAGLFATIEDLTPVARMLLGDGALDGSRVLSASTVRRLTSNQTPDADRPHGLGWRLPHDGSPSGPWSERSFGHTGFTGTSIWIDPDAGRFAILLTNHLLTGESSTELSNVRAKFHAAVADGGDELLSND
ncbi:serine hydrolase domain-containing protein [Halorarum halobium]|uniref:serine hydrolase domain-containing protein n=1 Tax=Halorarum halobium TaxID=3075121 RepID=UPI0028A5A9BB|nr:serine hydrolase domain-containing protein [Halobaculum sp. XH14]